MRPINIVDRRRSPSIESLRAFDIAYIINRGKNGLELLSILITNNSISEANLLGFGSAIAVGPAGHLARARSSSSSSGRWARTGRMSEVATPAVQVRRCGRPAASRWQRVALHVFLISMAVLWLFPLAVDVLHGAAPVRRRHPATATCRWPAHLSFDNFVTAWNGGELPKYFVNTLIVAIPAVLLTLWISSMLAYVFARFSFRLNLFAADDVHGAGTSCPPQVIIVPLYRIYLALPHAAAAQRQRAAVRPATSGSS